MFMKFVFPICLLGASVVCAEVIKIEAEDCTLNESAKIYEVADSSGLASADKYVKFAQGGESISFEFFSEEKSTFDIIVARRNLYEKNVQMYALNGEVDYASPQKEFLEASSTFDHFDTLTVATQKGTNTFTLKCGWGYVDIDYFLLEEHPRVDWEISSTPVTAKTEEAYKLLAFLKENFRKKTISGMMLGDVSFNYDYDNLALILDEKPYENCAPADSCKHLENQVDVVDFLAKTNKLPALVGFDFLFATGGHSDEGWFMGYTEQTVHLAKETWDKGGIPSFTWHWKVGVDTVFYTKSGGQAADSTKFDYSKAFKVGTLEWDTASENYKLLIEDIDKVSKHFLKLQEEGVALIFRPLHEAAGGWFWWGINGPEMYIKLFQLVVDRMTENGVENVLWVWNIERDPKLGYDVNALNKAWYPGDDYVDIIGVDIYNTAGNSNYGTDYFDKIVSQMGKHKIIALTENGPIPETAQMHENEAVWSWWMPWYNSWSSMFLTQTPDEIWSATAKDERIIFLNDMPGWDAYSAKTRKVKIPNAVKISLENRHLKILSSAIKETQIFDLQGNLILKSANKNILLSHLKTGVYLVKCKTVQGISTQKIQLK